MVGSRTMTALAGVAVSLVVSALAYVYFESLLLFLFVPFVPILFRRRAEAERPPAKRCPECGFVSHDPEAEYCPRDGTELTAEE